MSLKSLLESQYQIVFFRLTLDNLKLNDIFDSLCQYPKIHKIIVSEEESKNEKIHYHVLMMTSDSNQKNAKQNLKNYLVKLLDLKDNSTHAFSEFKKGTEKKIATYVVKDGKFLYKGFSENEIKIFCKMAYQKYDPKQFMLDREKLIENFLKDESEHDQEKLCQEYEKLKTKYNQKHTLSTMESDIRLINSKKYPGETAAVLYRKIFLN